MVRKSLALVAMALALAACSASHSAPVSVSIPTGASNGSTGSGLESPAEPQASSPTTPVAPPDVTVDDLRTAYSRDACARANA